MQIYFLGLILLLLLVYNLKVLPNPGYTPLLSDPGRWVAGLVLPTASPGLSSLPRPSISTRLTGLSASLVSSNGPVPRPRPWAVALPG